MNKIYLIRNRDVKRVLIGTPKGHQHLRVCMELRNGFTLIFQEATLANILRGYVTVKTHPKTRAQELLMKSLSTESIKKGFAKYQLLETLKQDEVIEEELRNLMDKSTLLKPRENVTS